MKSLKERLCESILSGSDIITQDATQKAQRRYEILDDLKEIFKMYELDKMVLNTKNNFSKYQRFNDEGRRILVRGIRYNTWGEGPYYGQTISWWKRRAKKLAQDCSKKFKNDDFQSVFVENNSIGPLVYYEWPDYGIECQIILVPPSAIGEGYINVDVPYEIYDALKKDMGWR